MTSLTYGQLPAREAFDTAFAEHVDGTRYRVRLGYYDARACDGFRLGNGSFTADELWDAITQIVNAEPDPIIASDDEFDEDVYQIYYPGADRPLVEIGPDTIDLVEWARKFSNDDIPEMPRERALEILNFATAYSSRGKCTDRKDHALDLVSGILGTLGFEWI